MNASELERMSIEDADENKLPPLADVLTVLGIAPFTRESVDRYQTKLADRLNSQSERWRAAANVVAWVLTISAIATMFAALFSSLPPAVFLVAAGLALLSIPATMLVNRWDMYYHWPVRNIADYNGAIPARVVELAKSVRRFCPEATAYVHYLEGHPDPFLMVGLGDEVYYLDVWDERDFQPTNGGV